jgi:hypothetical protein
VVVRSVTEGSWGQGWCRHFHAAMFVLHGESRMKYTGAHENDFAAHR